MSKINRILVANRGEIALRIMRTAREMGIETVAVYSDADRNAPHVRFADQAIHIGPSPSSESYLRIDKLLNACQQASADAVHPGYGFLSENEKFADAVERAGLTFIGPSPASIRIMGDKLSAKEAVSKFNVPLVPGTSTPVASVDEAKKIASKIGFPILIKASAGGGGKGMRLVEAERDLEEQLQRAINEAKSAFGDGSVFLEKYITQPRHIEFQIIGDKHGNIVHLFERECSIQRRHQKVIEEAPSSVLTPDLRAAMGEAAINVARSCNYFSTGTVEFIVDENLNYYFLEMNTRLQVEHPVTEMITGLDLVRLQIRIAEGEALPFRQEELTLSGHSIEARIYAEDPSANFLPDTGTLTTYRKPDGNGIRIDDGIEEGMDIPVYYDPMIGKLCTHAGTRKEAIDKMIRAINEFELAGVRTTLPFCNMVMHHDAFVSGKFDTRFIEKYYSPDTYNAIPSPDEELVAAMIAIRELQQNMASASGAPVKNVKSRWKQNRSGD